MSVKKALLWVSFWFTLAMAFNAGIYVFMGKEKALEFFGGYVIEQSLSLDNLFLFLLIFSCFGIKSNYQRRVLSYGIFGAVVLRLVFILLGVAIVNQFHWILYVFGAVLFFSGIKMFFTEEETRNFSDNRIIQMLQRIIPITDRLYEEKFFVRINKKLFATPLFAILVLIEGSDIIFAIDSIPAIFSVTTDPFIVYTSNIFAILGLRSMYFVLERLHEAFHLVKYGVATILTFTGVKLSLLFWNIEIPLGMSVAIIFSVIVLSICISLIIPERKKEHCN